MSRFLIPALVAVGLCSVGASASVGPAARSIGRGTLSVTAGASKAPLDPALCPAGTLPDGPLCLHLPGGDGDDSAPETEALPNAHHDKAGHWTQYDQIPRRPDRP